jgi:hypothetical protein
MSTGFYTWPSCLRWVENRARIYIISLGGLNSEFQHGDIGEKQKARALSMELGIIDFFPWQRQNRILPAEDDLKMYPR